MDESSTTDPEEHAAIRRRAAMQVTFLSIDQRAMYLLKRLKKCETFSKTRQGVSVDTGLKSSGLLAVQALPDGSETLIKRLAWIHQQPRSPSQQRQGLAL
ncbi:hypothetical protein [Synechococcus sp. MU1625]|uniref:hypothetical protein n=1 Tax=Synechococcus sp. MU1625 TaxID=2508347 RepID=UPI001CF8F192|nr:hypothetical protein [Synechococcus sp. MU1625]